MKSFNLIVANMTTIAYGMTQSAWQQPSASQQVVEKLGGMERTT